MTDGIHEALDRARKAAAGLDVRIGGGPNTVRRYLRAQLIDELHLAITPAVVGAGEPLFEGLHLKTLGYECVEFRPSDTVTHVVLRRQRTS